MHSQKKIIAMLREHGYKLTPQRRAILAVIADSREHLTPAAIWELVRQSNPDIGLVTVYRTMDILAGLGLICQVHAGNNCRSYLIRRPSAHHHHLICSHCGRVTDFTDCDLSGLEEKLRRQTGFAISSHLLEFLGCCPDCLRESRNVKC